jgi:UDP-galactopyranose mutase
MALDNTNRQKVSYYERFLELPDNRLCKSVFNEMVRKDDSFWNYKEHVSSLINQPDVNFGIHIKEFNKLYGSQVRDKLLMEVSSKSSLGLKSLCSQSRRIRQFSCLSAFSLRKLFYGS